MTRPLTPEHLATLRAVAGKATPEQWVACPENEFIFAGGDMVAEVRGIGAMLNTERNAAHIAAFDPPTALTLLDEVERLREMLGEVVETWGPEAEEHYVSCSYDQVDCEVADRREDNVGVRCEFHDMMKRAREALAPSRKGGG